MPVTIVPVYCPNCRCESCLKLRYPETPGEAGRRIAREIWDKAQADLDE